MPKHYRTFAKKRVSPFSRMLRKMPKFMPFFGMAFGKRPKPRPSKRPKGVRPR